MVDQDAIFEKEAAVGGAKDLLLKIEVDKKLVLRGSVEYPLTHAIDWGKTKLPAWMQSIINGFEQKYEDPAPSDEGAPAGQV